LAKVKPDSLYALAHINLGLLLLSRILEVSYDELIRNRKFQTRITIDQHKDSKVRQELYQANPYKEPRQDAGVLYYLMIKNLKMILKFLNRNLSNHYYLYLSSTYRKFPNFGVKLIMYT
jgi:hypothetical protein